MEEEITCHLCGGKAVLKYENLELDDGKITIHDSPFFECSKCHEAFATSEQMEDLSDQINTRFVFKRPVINAGRSLAVTLPSDLVHYYNLKKGVEIQFIPKNRKEIQITIK